MVRRAKRLTQPKYSSRAKKSDHVKKPRLAKAPSDSDGLGSLKALPLELRQEIYRICLMGRYCRWSGDSIEYILGRGRELLSVSKTFYKEARPIETDCDIVLFVSGPGPRIRPPPRALQQIVVQLNMLELTAMLDTEEWGCFDERHFPRLKLIVTSLNHSTAQTLFINGSGSCEDVMKGGIDETIIAHAKHVMYRYRDRKGVPDYTKLPDHVQLLVQFPKIVYLEEYRASMVSLHSEFCAHRLMR